MSNNKKIYDHYEVEETFKEDGSWSGYVCRCLTSNKKQGKLYIKSDGREFYKEKPKDDLIIPDPQIPEYDREYIDLTDGKRKILKGRKSDPKDEELEI